MNSKGRVRAVLERKPVDRVPLDCWLHEQRFCDKLEQDYGPIDQFLDEYHIDLVSCFVPWPNQFGEKDERYFHQKFEVEELPGLGLESPRDSKWISNTEWHPIFRGVNVVDAVERYGKDKFVVAHCWGMVEGTSSFLGIENCWLSLMAEPEHMKVWLEKYAHWLGELCVHVLEQGVDMIRISDDWGSNDTELFAPETFEELIIPNLTIVIDRIKAAGGNVGLHSDGYIMGVLDPCQDSAGMDPEYVKENYGEKIVIHGGLDIMDAMIRLSDEELRDYVRKQFEIFKPGGGFIFSGSHLIQPDIDPKRLCMVYELANELAPYEEVTA
jgi:uroporphyrinogen decarboxylase